MRPELTSFLSLLSLASLATALSENNELYNNLLEVVERAQPGVRPMMVEQELTPNRVPYLNTFQQRQQVQAGHGGHHPYGLDILGLRSQEKTNQQLRPTLESLSSYAASQGKTVSTPEDLLTMCCQYPACYDPLYELCIDTCRKCETVYPVTSWLPCPPLLNIPDCTSPNLSYRGPLPLVCYPDIGPFGNILPLDIINTASQTFAGQTAGARGGPSGKPGQAYRQAIRQTNRKLCSDQGICHSEPSSSGSLWG